MRETMTQEELWARYGSAVKAFDAGWDWDDVNGCYYRNRKDDGLLWYRPGCTCGSHKTMGPQWNLHSDWCDIV